MKYEIKAKSNENVIEITTELKREFDNVKQEISRQIINLQDQAVRDALIKLGWTPPPHN